MEMTEAANAELLEKLLEGKTVQLAPQGISMLPFIHGGSDKVLVRKEERIDVGDIVLAPYHGRLILHRVYAINGTRLILMGDGNLKGHEELDRSEVCGKVLKIVKPNGHSRKLTRACLWRKLLPVRKPLMKLYMKWNKIVS